VRGAEAYRETTEIASQELTRLVALYHASQGRQTLRLLRDSMDHWLRRVHGYSIEGGAGVHYRERVTRNHLPPPRTVFEHVIPAAQLRDMLLAGVLTPAEALNPPTCTVTRTTDAHLRRCGAVSVNTTPWHFFRRYASVPGLVIETRHGHTVDLDAWTLEDHYRLFA
jgi:hypothetical protein